MLFCDFLEGKRSTDVFDKIDARFVVGEEFIIIDQRSVLLECGHDVYIAVFYR